MNVFIVLGSLVAFGLAEVFCQSACIPSVTAISKNSSLGNVNGHNAARNQFPYEVSLQISGPRNLRHVCGGSIVSRNWVLTAAQCTCMYKAAHLRVVAGILLLSDTRIPGQQEVKVRQIIQHPLYPSSCRNAPPVAANDIALLRLAKQLQYTVNVQPIRIPTHNHVLIGMATLSGWGVLRTDDEIPNQLQFANVPIYSAGQCKIILDYRLNHAPHPFSITLNLCSATVSAHESVCSGDSGSPFIKDDTVIGVVSWGLTGAPRIYTRTNAYVDWIITTTNGEVRPQN